MENEKKLNKEEDVVKNVIERFTKGVDTAFIAALKRADNPSTEYQAWEYLAGYKIDLEKDWERLPYVTVLAAMARAKPARDGSIPLGTAIARCYDSKVGVLDGNKNDQAKAKLRRVLACDSVAELCTVLRPLMALINSRGVKINYGALLHDLVKFNPDYAEKTKARWAQSFFRYVADEEET